MENVFLKLLNMSITAGWLVLAVVVLRLILKKAPKWVSCLLWCLVGIRLVFPFSFESVLSLIPSSETLPSDIITENSFNVNTGLESVDTRVNAYLGSRYYEGVTVPANNGANVMNILSIIWIAGIFIMLSYTVISFLRIRRKAAPSVAIENNIFICDGIDTPFILGLFRPKIFLPSDMNENDTLYVIAHERAHLKRHDHLWKPLGFLLLTVYWFNPLMWAAYILLCRDIELACDEKVIKEMGDVNKKPYSEALINCSMPRKMISACPLAFGEVGVKKRIKTVLNYKKPAFWISIIAVVALSVTAVCFLTDPMGDSLREKNENIPQSIEVKTPDGSYDIASTAAIDYTLDFLEDVQVSRNPITLSRSEDRDKTNTITLSFEKTSVSYYFNGDFTEVWSADGVKPTQTQKVYTTDLVRQFFENKIEEPVSVNADGEEFWLTSPSFEATVLKVNENSVLVEPLDEGMDSRITVGTNVESAVPVPELKKGSIIKVIYDGAILATFPSITNKEYAIYLLGEDEEIVNSKAIYNKPIEQLRLIKIKENKHIIFNDENYRNNMLEYLNTYDCKVVNEDNWANQNASDPKEYAFAIDFSDGTSVILNIHFDFYGGNSEYYVAIAESQKPFNKISDYSDYNRYVISWDFYWFLSGLIK